MLVIIIRASVISTRRKKPTHRIRYGKDVDRQDYNPPANTSACMNIFCRIQHAHHGHACEQYYTSVDGRSTSTPTINEYDSQYGESKDANSRDARRQKLCLS